ncbi:MAG: hypothetical protein HQL31_03835 [Planctomycetes bacterium]|nr:hypothetical protein [Planctomycetota bacterium]
MKRHVFAMALMAACLVGVVFHGVAQAGPRNSKIKNIDRSFLDIMKTSQSVDERLGQKNNANSAEAPAVGDGNSSCALMAEQTVAGGDVSKELRDLRAEIGQLRRRLELLAEKAEAMEKREMARRQTP